MDVQLWFKWLKHPTLCSCPVKERMWCFVETSVTQRDRLIQAPDAHHQVFAWSAQVRVTSKPQGLPDMHQALDMTRAMQLKSPHGGRGLWLHSVVARSSEST